MTIFKKKVTENNISSKKQEDAPVDSLKIKKKVRIGFGHKTKREEKHSIPPDTNTTQHTEQTIAPLNETIHQQNTSQQYDNVDVFLEEVTTKDNEKKENIFNSETPVQHDWSTVKRKTFTQKDMKGKVVYLEDTGEKIGTVFDAVCDADKNLIGYKIKDSKSETILSFPLDQFDEDKNGLIFIPSWYMKGMKTVEKLEFKDRITPELIWLIKDNTVSTEELYSIFVKHDDTIVNYIEEAVSIRELVNNRLKILEKERLGLKQNLMDLTEKRLINDLDRRQFSEIVMEHRRKVNTVDINIKKCKALLDRLQRTSFGLLSNSIASTVEKEEQQDHQYPEENWRKTRMPSEDRKEDLYKQKFFELKEEYEKLQERYNELKIAVEKLLNKNDF